MSLLAELRRRNVIRVATAYIAVAWLIVQVLDTLAPLFGISESAARLIVMLLGIGLVPVLAMSWLFELTPDGFRRERDVDHASQDSRRSTRLLDRAIIAVLALAVVYFAVDKFVFDPGRDVALLTKATEQARAEALVGSFGDRSIAVLPFNDTSADLDQAYLSEGIAEEIINLLSTVRDIRVIARSSSFAFHGRDLSLADVAERLNVRYILEGSLRRAGDRLRVTAQMIDPRTDTALWSQSFDREFGDIFAIQDQIAGEVVEKLAIELAGVRPTSRPIDPEAYALYLRAKNLVNRQDWNLTQEGEKLLEQSLAIDPDNPEGWMLYGPILGQKVYFTDYTYPEMALELRDKANKALAIDPDNVRAKALLSSLSFEAMSSWVGEVRATAYAMSLEPNNPEFNAKTGVLLRSFGYYDRAVEYVEYAAAKDPLSARVQRSLMIAYLEAGNFEAGLEANRRLREITGGIGGLWYYGMMHLLAGDTDAALAAFDDWAAGSRAGDDDGLAIHGRALVHLVRGERADYERQLARLKEVEGANEYVAILYAWDGRQDEAIELFATYIDPPRNFGAELMKPALLRGLDGHPRWDELLRGIGTHPDQVAEFGLEDLFPGPGLPPLVPVDPP